MNSIAVTKPDMAVMRRDRLGLSLFGLLALAFGNEVSTRSTWNAGWYRELPLDFLEQEENAPAVPASAEPVQIKVDLKGMLDKLQNEPSSAPRMTQTEQRILERVYLLERRIERQTTVYPHMTVHLESASRLQKVDAPLHAGNAGSEKERSNPEKSKQPSGAGEALDRVGERLIRMVQSGVQPDRGYTAMRVTKLESLGRLSAPLTPVVSSTAAPAEGGWTPRWQEEHPGFPQKGAQHDQAPAAGSILLPDLLRQRRKQAVDDSETVALHAGEGLLHRTAAGEPAQNDVSVSQRQDGMRELVQRLDRAVDQVIARSQTRSAGQQRAASQREESAGRMQDDHKDRNAAIHAINGAETQATRNVQSLVNQPKAPNEAAQDKRNQADDAAHESRLTASVPWTDETDIAAPVEQTVRAAQNLGTDGAEQMARPLPYTDAALSTTEEELYHRQEAAREAQPDRGVVTKAHAETQTNAESRTPSQHDPRTVQAVGEERTQANPAASEELHYRQEQASEAQPDSRVTAKEYAEKRIDTASSPQPRAEQRAMQPIHADHTATERMASEELYHRQDISPEAQPNSGAMTKAQAEKQTNAVSSPQPRAEQSAAHPVHAERVTAEQASGAHMHLQSGNIMKTQSDSGVVSETNAYLQTDDAPRTPIQRDSRTVQAVGQEYAEANPATSEELYYRQEALPEAQSDGGVAAKTHAQKQMNAVSHSVPYDIPRTAQTTERGHSTEAVRTVQASNIRTLHDHRTAQQSPVGDVVEDKPSISHAVAMTESEQDALKTARAVARPAETATVQPAEVLQHRTPLDESAVLPPANRNQPNKQPAQPAAKRTAPPMTGHPVQAHRALPMRPYRAAQTVLRPIASVQQAVRRTSESPAEPTISAFGGEALTYLPVQNGAAQAPRTTETDAALHQNMAQLPDWAQRFLQQPVQPAGAAQQGSAVQHPAAVGAQLPAAKPTSAQQIEWTAPNAMSPAASIVYAEHKPQPTQPPQQAARLSDSELHRAADKVYRIIEERLRKELRRSGK